MLWSLAPSCPLGLPSTREDFRGSSTTQGLAHSFSWKGCPQTRALEKSRGPSAPVRSRVYKISHTPVRETGLSACASHRTHRLSTHSPHLTALTASQGTHRLSTPLPHLNALTASQRTARHKPEQGRGCNGLPCGGHIRGSGVGKQTSGDTCQQPEDGSLVWEFTQRCPCKHTGYCAVCSGVGRSPCVWVVWAELCPLNSYVEILVPSISECNCIWRCGVGAGSSLKRRSS